MEMINILSRYDNPKILVPKSSYNIKKDPRILIPFMIEDRIGFINRENVVIVEPKFAAYFGEFYNNVDMIKVAITDTYGYPRMNGRVSTYHRLAYGILNAQGNLVIEPKYLSLIPSIGGTPLFAVQNNNYQYGVIDMNNRTIVPFGKYSWIDGFDHGLARAIINAEKHSNYGIIDENGNEVLPVIYDDIWNFYGKNKETTIATTNGIIDKISLKSLRKENAKSTSYNELPF